MNIVRYPNPVLRQKAEPVSLITPEIQALIPEMIEAMYENAGIGLAAPQIGRSEQIFIVETSPSPRENTRKRSGEPRGFLNPVMEKKSRETDEEEEGCLSLPGIFLPVKRAVRIELTCTTPDGKEVRIEAEGLTARIFQHEIDHLKGMLIIDRVSPWRRWKVRSQLKALERKDEHGGTRR